MSTNALEAEIRRRIARVGPMPVKQFMNLCLSHPQHGYYMTRDPLGRGGDFITAPEVSQMFGELIGLWAAAVWRRMGEPENVRLVELGPGRGTMMHDALRAAHVLPGFRAALVVHLVEISPVLQQLQKQTLDTADVTMLWHHSFEEVPEGPLIVLANEFFDALPVHQAVKHVDGWYERTVEIDDAGNFTFGIAQEPLPLFEQLLPAQLHDAPMGALYEWRSDNLALDIARRVVRNGGAGLVIDYGHVESATGETLQAVGGHAFADPLAAPGTVDLTAHVDFQGLALAFDSMGARVHGPLEQAIFLRALGIEKRAEALKAHATREQAKNVDLTVARLAGVGRTGMGMLFKVLGFAHPDLGELPAFES
jgi:NADH dehydrogenase [ubiquinone] 1 alpha subcomplex assembly factor 7